MKPALTTAEQHERDTLGIRAEQTGTTLRVSLLGTNGMAIRLNASNIDLLGDQVRKAIRDGANWMVLNLGGCLDIDGRAMKKLVKMRDEFASHGGGIVLEESDRLLVALFVAHNVAEKFEFSFEHVVPSEVVG